MSTESESKEISKLHEDACAKNQDTYIDPVTGYLVFTKIHHLKRGHCCKSGCRHCPYGFKKIEVK